MGLTIHAMAGYNERKIVQGLHIPPPFRVAAIVAAGYRGTVESLPEEVRAKDLKPRVRKPASPSLCFEMSSGRLFERPFAARAKNRS